ncbi:PPE domain-containing protein [Streptoalloteichus tenebrarius]|uniref:PPE domain-containing protein n=1 Tax=Streptoalloteichus tenebrarius (strain ATCC 17920 / DSM 40477 / JCM 4838 / CBS 697.72 / NBRC 16177 / NCIMB 11028 / NRRL B-12390 / A12253. 1 / ISP 5477) TaxID=1933 RepID=UPI0035ED048A
MEPQTGPVREPETLPGQEAVPAPGTPSAAAVSSAPGQEATVAADLVLTDSPNWAAMSHRELYDAVHHGNDPGQAYSLAQEWTDLATEMTSSGQLLAQRISGTEAGWQGPAADAARLATVRLATWSESAGQTAHQMGAKVANQAQIMEQAKASMPEPVDFDYDRELARFAPQGNGDLASFQAVTQDLRARQAAAQAAHQQAVDVMVAMEQQSRTVDATTPLFAPPPEVVRRNDRTPLAAAAGQASPAGANVEYGSAVGAFGAGAAGVPTLSDQGSDGSGRQDQVPGYAGYSGSGDASTTPQFTETPREPAGGWSGGGGSGGWSGGGGGGYSGQETHRPPTTNPAFTPGTTVPSGGGDHEWTPRPKSGRPDPYVPQPNPGQYVPGSGSWSGAGNTPPNYPGVPNTGAPGGKPGGGGGGGSTTNPWQPKGGYGPKGGVPTPPAPGTGSTPGGGSTPGRPNLPNWTPESGMRGVTSGFGGGGGAGAPAGGGFGGGGGGGGYRTGGGFGGSGGGPSSEVAPRGGSAPVGPGGSSGVGGPGGRPTGFGPTGSSTFGPSGGSSTTPVGGGMGAGGHGARGEEDKEHRTPGYLKDDDLFGTDADRLPPSVIGVTFKKRNYHEKPRDNG